MKLSNAIEDFFIARSDLSEATVTDYGFYLGLWCEQGHDPELEQVSAQCLQQFVHWLSNEYRAKHGGFLSRSGVKNAVIALKSFWRWASEVYGLENVSNAIRKPAVPQPEIMPFTKDEIQALLKSCYHTRIADYERSRPHRNRRPEAERDAAILLLLLDTGIRVSELCRLEVRDLNLGRREIEIRPFESGLKSRGRVIPFSRDTQTLLLRWYAVRREDEREIKNADGELPGDAPVFCLIRTGYGRPMRSRSVAHILTRLGKRVGIGDVHPHRFRHTFAIEYLRGGGDPWTLQKILGHSTMEMVRRYLHLADEDVRKTHERASAVGRWRLHLPR